MPDLRELIRHYPELGEVFAEWENRISFLENSQGRLPEEPKEVKPAFRPRPIDDEVDQLKSGFLHLQRKLNEHTDATKKKGKY